MRAPISVVVPTLNAEAALPGLLASLMEGVEAGLIRDLILSDGGSTDGTRAIAQAAGADILTGDPSRGGQLRRGCDAAQGVWLLILHADSRLPPGWSLQAEYLLDRPGAYYGWLRFDSVGFAPRVVAGWANLRSRLFGLPFGDQGLLMPTALYRDCGGYRDMPLMEDIAMARALRGHLRPMGIEVLTSADRYRRDGWIRRGAGNLLRQVRYGLGTAPARLRKDYDA
ncbi:glycosyltransferase [Pseudoprimorskyibacter insulae]|uniref:PGL/p-HBAD biosynthesis glycosyltransferase n=1 Tax=Pseudoprimorskyibacter insulae TaxID=1695997 RepID=A0A2R8B169_9RHOB|nr:glycosyltransferase [Pseudoprimorskyibacter insulae]SPF81914.1 PGL/p-HBAD biosynthesis glycosyltransferase [Pseudoprimorskyibacter insulae]